MTRLARGLGAAACAAALALAGCGPDAEPPTAGDDYTDMSADQIMVELEHFITVDGVRRGLLKADTAFLYEDSALVRVRPVHLTIYDQQGGVAGIVTAERGLLNTRNEQMTATGNVVVEAQQRGQRIETEEMHFDPQRDRIWSDVATTIHRDGTVLHGSGFTSDSKLTDTRLTNPSGQVKGLEFDL